MKKKDLLKTIALGIILILFINLVLFALQIIKGLIFWGVIILAAIFAFKLIPKLKSS